MLPDIPITATAVLSAEGNDAEEVAGMLLGCDVPYLRTGSVREGREWWLRTQGRDRNYVSGPATLAWVLRPEGRPAGMLLVKLAPPEAMLACWLAPDFRGQGLARAAIAAVLPWLAGQGVTVVRADTRAENAAARRLMAATGFPPVGDPDSGVVRFRRDLTG